MDIKIENKIIKTLTNLLGKPVDEVTEVKKEEFGIMTSSNVCMIISKTKKSKKILARWLHLQKEPNKIPELNYDLKHYEESKCKYNSEYLILILKLMAISEKDYVIVSVRKDYPSVYENSYFKVILAPIVI